MDWFYFAAIALVAAGVAVYIAYKDWKLRQQNASLSLRVEQAIGNTVTALDRLDKVADKHYGEGSIPEHITNIRDDLEVNYRLLTGVDK